MAVSQAALEKIQMTIEAWTEDAKSETPTLNDFENGFMASTEERIKLYGDRTYVSDKQMRILNDIYDKLVV